VRAASTARQSGGAVRQPVPAPRPWTREQEKIVRLYHGMGLTPRRSWNVPGRTPLAWVSPKTWPPGSSARHPQGSGPPLGLYLAAAPFWHRAARHVGTTCAETASGQLRMPAA
jgi:hypothetical protein